MGCCQPLLTHPDYRSRLKKGDGKMKKFLMVSMVLAAVLGSVSIANAQDKVKYKKKTTIDLSASVIEGDLVRPEGSYIVNRKVSRFSKMIMDRNDFIVELLQSANDL
jgi:hypothetical protein